MKFNLMNFLRRWKIGILFSLAGLLVIMLVYLSISSCKAVVSENNEQDFVKETFIETDICTEEGIDVNVEVTIKDTEPIETDPPSTNPELEPWNEVPLSVELQYYIVQEAKSKNIRPEIIFAMCWRESNYGINDIGDGGDSYGMLQIQPKWHYDTMLELGCTNLLDPYQNAKVGVTILADLIEKNDGNIIAALVAYNAGSYKGTVTEYAESVINEAERIYTYNPDKH